MLPAAFILLLVTIPVVVWFGAKVVPAGDVDVRQAPRDPGDRAPVEACVKGVIGCEGRYGGSGSCGPLFQSLDQRIQVGGAVVRLDGNAHSGLAAMLTDGHDDAIFFPKPLIGFDLAGKQDDTASAPTWSEG